MKRSTFNILFYLNTSKRKKSGLCPVMGRITVDGNIAQFSLKEDVHPENWDAKKGKTKGKTREQTELNRKILLKEQYIKDVYQRIVETTGYVTAEQLKNELTGITGKAETLLKLFREHNAEYEKRVGIDRKYSSFYHYKNSFVLLSGFIQSKYGSEDYPLKQLEMSFINEYDLYLRTNTLLNTNSIVRQMMILKKMVTRAIHQGSIRRNPFSDYIPDRLVWKYLHISKEELERLIATPIQQKNVCLVPHCVRVVFFRKNLACGEHSLRNAKNESRP